MDARQSGGQDRFSVRSNPFGRLVQSSHDTKTMFQYAKVKPLQIQLPVGYQMTISSPLMSLYPTPVVKTPLSLRPHHLSSHL